MEQLVIAFFLLCASIPVSKSVKNLVEFSLFSLSLSRPHLFLLALSISSVMAYIPVFASVAISLRYHLSRSHASRTTGEREGQQQSPTCCEGKS
jgi:hypothetical protein